MSNIGHNAGPIDDVEDDRSGNWFAVSRDIFAHHIVGIHDRPWTEFEAWLSLVAMASYETRRAMNKGTVVILDPGDLMAAHGYLAQRWMWTVPKVRWFLQRLQKEAMITRHCNKQDSRGNSNQIQIISICNYSRYQIIKDAEQQAKQQAEQQANSRPTASQQQEDNTLTSEHLDSCAPNGADADEALPSVKRAPRKPKPTAKQFEMFWAAYPNRSGKPAALKKFMALSPEDAEQAIFAAEKYAEQCRAAGTEAKFIKWPQGWLTERRFEDFSADTFIEPAPRTVGEKTVAWGWWRGPVNEKLRALPEAQWRKGILTAQPNGIWPWWVLGAPPGHEECLVPQSLLDEYGYVETYRGKIEHV